MDVTKKKYEENVEDRQEKADKDREESEKNVGYTIWQENIASSVKLFSASKRLRSIP